jgi:hypothetical protein
VITGLIFFLAFYHGCDIITSSKRETDMTQDQANQLQVGDQVSIQRSGRPSRHYGTVISIASQIEIAWQPYTHNGRQDGGTEYHQPQFMDRIDRT